MNPTGSPLSWIDSEEIRLLASSPAVRPHATAPLAAPDPPAAPPILLPRLDGLPPDAAARSLVEWAAAITSSTQTFLLDSDGQPLAALTAEPRLLAAAASLLRSWSQTAAVLRLAESTAPRHALLQWPAPHGPSLLLVQHGPAPLTLGLLLPAPPENPALPRALAAALALLD